MKKVETSVEQQMLELAGARARDASRLGGRMAKEVAVVTNLVRILVARGVAAQPVRRGTRRSVNGSDPVPVDVWCDPRA